MDSRGRIPARESCISRNSDRDNGLPNGRQVPLVTKMQRTKKIQAYSITSSARPTTDCSTQHERDMER